MSIWRNWALPTCNEHCGQKTPAIARKAIDAPVSYAYHTRMTSLTTIYVAINRLKDEIQKALQLAASSGRYSDAAQLAALALHLDQAPGGPSRKTKPTHAVRMMQVPALPKGTKPSVVVAASPMQGEYPRFKSLDGSLVKVGWSSKVASEYRHTVERNALKHVLECVAAAGKSVKFFRPTDINRAHHDGGGEGTSGIPDYQINAVLAWLRSVGLVVKRGRSGYVLASPRTFLSAASAALSMLPADDFSTQSTKGI